MPTAILYPKIEGQALSVAHYLLHRFLVDDEGNYVNSSMYDKDGNYLDPDADGENVTVTNEGVRIIKINKKKIRAEAERNEEEKKEEEEEETPTKTSKEKKKKRKERKDAEDDNTAHPIHDDTKENHKDDKKEEEEEEESRMEDLEEMEEVVENNNNNPDDYDDPREDETVIDDDDDSDVDENIFIRTKSKDKDTVKSVRRNPERAKSNPTTQNEKLNWQEVELGIVRNAILNNTASNYNINSTNSLLNMENGISYDDNNSKTSFDKTLDNTIDIVMGGNESTSNGDNSVDQCQPKKRGRKKGSKNKKTLAAEAAAAAAAAANPDAAAVDITATPVTPVKRKRGRPRKVKVEEVNVKKEEEEEGGDENNDVYDVEAIRDVLVEDGVTYYYVKWAGYDEMTWEPEENCVGCEKKIKQFYRNRKNLLREQRRIEKLKKAQNQGGEENQNNENEKEEDKEMHLDLNIKQEQDD